MRIHTDTMSKAEVASHLGMPDDVTVHVTGQHGSRSHRIAFEVALRGHGKRHTKNPATTEKIDGKSATWADWGQYLANLYRMDGTMVAGPYQNRDHFHRVTKGQFNY